MTAIAGLIAADGSVWMGADSCLSFDDSTKREDAAPKIIRRRNLLIGAAGDARRGHVAMQSVARWPKRRDGMSPDDYLAGPAIAAIRQAWKAAGEPKMPRKDGACDILIAYCGGLFILDDTGYVTRTRHRFDAIGCGGPICVGALAALAPYDVPPREALTVALKAAAASHSSVAPPFRILRLAP
jgi:ATP-dependent protease HslVU (ClpYQ) peptidase subunit